MPKTPWEEALASLRSSACDGIRLFLHWPSCWAKRRRPRGIFVSLKLLTIPTLHELQSLFLGTAVEAVLAVEEDFDVGGCMLPHERMESRLCYHL
jgi:hypothetical protein